MVEVSRSGFICGVGAAFLANAFCADEKPYLRAGFLTDTHIRPGADEINERTRLAFGIFRRQCVDVIGHCGDLADLHYPEAYAYYRQCIDQTYPDADSRPRLLYVYANHDLIDVAKMRAGVSGLARQMPYVEGFRDMQRRLGIDHWLFHREVVNGVPFIVFPQSFEIDGGADRVERMLAETVAEFPTGPIVVMAHNAPAKTVYQSERWGYWRYRQILDNYPRVISFSGHTHNSLRNELSIWQGTFTAVDVGCLEWWYGGLGMPEVAKSAYDVIVAEFFPSRIVLRRYDVRDGCEYRPDDPWIARLPYDAGNCDFAPSIRGRSEPVSAFLEGAKLLVCHDGDRVRLSFPPVEDEDRVLSYRIEAAVKVGKEEWNNCVEGGVFSEFHLQGRDRTKARQAEIPINRFQKEVTYRFSVTPVGFFGASGKPLRANWQF